MNLEEQLMNYKKLMQVRPQEVKIEETVKRAAQAFYATEQEEILSYHEFLWIQFKGIRKRWWLLQALSLLILWTVLFSSPKELEFYAQRSMGIIAPLFVIFIIPELWKTKSNQCIEIETAAYYSIRQIYSARILLFGVVDVALITVFCGAASTMLCFALTELLIQFLFPMTVTACICFKILCSKRTSGEAAAVIWSVAWSSLWMLIILNESIYEQIVFPVWTVLFGLALLLLGATIYHTWKNCNKYYEVIFDGIDI